MSSLTKDQARAALLDAICAIAPETDTTALLPGAPLRQQIDLDSFDFLNVIIGLHQRLGIEVPERDYAELATLERAVEYLVKRAHPA